MEQYLPTPMQGAALGGSYDSSAKMARMPTLAERMDYQIKEAEDRLKDLREARELLDKNPDLERLLNIMQKGRF